VFRPENLLRAARRQKRLSPGDVPETCLLDPDGDVVRYLRHVGRARLSPNWACYHTELYEAEHEGVCFGVIGCAVGAPFAVLVAEQLFASGCHLLVSITSSGQVAPPEPASRFILIDRALRDEGTSHHYLPPATFAEADPLLADAVMDALVESTLGVRRGATWTTDAPFRETEAALAAARTHGTLAVEMEAAALYAFAQARGRPVLCFARVTNQLALGEGDFDKGEAEGALDALEILAATKRAWSLHR
jgi:uridine phosphorylase